jgi:hypothetical protein
MTGRSESNKAASTIFSSIALLSGSACPTTERSKWPCNTAELVASASEIGAGRERARHNALNCRAKRSPATASPRISNPSKILHLEINT